jgi:uncharacterized protein YecE (DUF72 family)
MALFVRPMPERERRREGSRFQMETLESTSTHRTTQPENSRAKTTLWLGTAGWNVPSACRDRVGCEGSHLERYAQVLNAVEINTSFYRPHRRTTYEKWSRATPAQFRFAVKVPRSVTHVDGLADAEIRRFLDETAGLGEKLAVFLIQFPPSKRFDEQEAHTLFESLQVHTSVHLVCEPRHASWFTPDIDQWLAERRIARVAADPAPATNADLPGGWQGLRYFRLHGAPRVYYSAYDEPLLTKLGERLSATQATSETWCIFDNTAMGAAMENALSLKARHDAFG